MKKCILLLSLLLTSIVPKNGYERKLNERRKMTNTQTTFSEEISYETNNLIVILEEDCSGNVNVAKNILNKVENNGFNLISKGGKDIYLVKVDDVEKGIEHFENLEEIYYVTSDFPLKMNSLNDTVHTTSSGEYAFDLLKIEEAWQYETGSTNVLVGIIDSGIDSSHPDLLGKVSQNLSCSFINGSYTIERQPSDQNGHGTFIAGIIGAQVNNGKGIAGVCKNVTLVSLKVFEEDNSLCNASDVILAINYADDNNIPILNLSFGWYFENSRFDPAIETAIESYDGLVVCSSGNENNDNDNGLYQLYPASYSCNNIISVGASNSYDMKTYHSNFGASTVDLFAPGENVYGLITTTNGDTRIYGSAGGTSLAAPYVTAVAALLLASDSTLTPIEIKNIILDNVDYVSDLDSYCVTGGRLNAYKAVYSINHSHSYSYSTYNNIYHIKSCNLCDLSYNEEHTWVSTPLISANVEPSYIPGGYRCTLCGAVTSTII